MLNTKVDPIQSDIFFRYYFVSSIFQIKFIFIIISIIIKYNLESYIIIRMEEKLD